MTAPLPRHVPLVAPVSGVSAAWLWRRLRDEATTAPAALARVAGTEAGRQLAYTLAAIEQAANEWQNRALEDASAAREPEPVSANRTAAQKDPRSGAAFTHEITTAEAADLLGVTGGRIRQWCRDDTLTARRVGGSWLIDRSSAEDLRDARRSAA